MRIYKIAEDEQQEELLHFYVPEPAYTEGKSLVYERPFGIPVDTFKSIYNRSKAKRGEDLFRGEVLHAAYDIKGGRLYLPDQKANAYFFRHPDLKSMLAACYEVLQEKHKIKDLKPQPIIKGDPLSSIRVRKIGDFLAAKQFIEKHLLAHHQDQSLLELPVVEANMDMMPTTLHQLDIEENAQGLLVKKDQGQSVTFTLKPNPYEGQRKSVVAHVQETPFILINLSPKAKVSEADKERVVVTYLQDYSSKDRSEMSHEELIDNMYYSMKYILYLGWSLKDLSYFVLGPGRVNSFQDFWLNGTYLLQAQKALEKTGYQNTFTPWFYYTFKARDDFPIKLPESEPGQAFDTSGQPEVMQILHYDKESQFLVLKSKLYIQPETAKNIFNAHSDVTVGEYDPTDHYIKTNLPTDMMQHTSPVSMKIMTEDMKRSGGKLPEDLPAGKFPFKIKTPTDVHFEKKKISDYFQAADFIRETCKKLTSDERPIEFQDLDVYVGPWIQVSQGQLGLGGFISEERMKKAKLEIPYEIIPGLKLYPPAILIDSQAYPSVADRSNFLVHEFRHNINNIMGIESPDYEIPPKGSWTPDKVKKWLFYLKSPDERLAHITQIKYFLSSGMGREQILRVFLKEGITEKNLPIARRYNQLIEEAQEEFHQEQSQKDQTRAVDKALEQLQEETNLDLDFEAPQEYLL